MSISINFFSPAQCQTIICNMSMLAYCWIEPLENINNISILMKTIKLSALCRPNCEIMTIVVGVPVRPPQRQYLKTCVHWKSLSKHIDNFSNTFIGLMYWFWRLFKTLEHAVEKENMLGKMETCVFVFYTNDILRKLMFLYMYMIHVYIYIHIYISGDVHNGV